jgi:hypothetical protein
MESISASYRYSIPYEYILSPSDGWSVKKDYPDIGRYA